MSAKGATPMPHRPRNVARGIALLVSVLLAGCSLSDASFLLDNPGAEPITVSVDGQPHALPADSGTTLRLAVGKHALTLPDGKTVEFIVYADSEGGVINPTHATYVLYDVIYATDDAASQRFAPMQSVIAIDGRSFAGPLQVRDGLLLDRRIDGWDFDPREAIPDTLQVERSLAGNIQTKLFGPREFLAYYPTDPSIATDVDREHATTGFARRGDPPCPLGNPLVVDVFTDPGVRTLAQRIKSTVAEYRRSADASEQRRLADEYHTALTAMVHAQVAAGAASVEQNLCYNDLVRGSGAIIGAGVLIVE